VHTRFPAEILPQIKQAAERSLEAGQLTPNLTSPPPPSSLARVHTVRQSTPSRKKGSRRVPHARREGCRSKLSLDPSPAAQALPHKAAGFSGLREGTFLTHYNHQDKGCPCKIGNLTTVLYFM